MISVARAADQFSHLSALRTSRSANIGTGNNSWEELTRFQPSFPPFFHPFANPQNGAAFRRPALGTKHPVLPKARLPLVRLRRADKGKQNRKLFLRRLMQKSARMVLRGVAIAVLVLAWNAVWAEGTIQPQDRLREDITESSMVILPGNGHPALACAVSEASVAANFPMDHMILLLRPGSAQLAALQLVEQQHDPQPSQYLQFLTGGNS